MSFIDDVENKFTPFYILYTKCLRTLVKFTWEAEYAIIRRKIIGKREWKM